MLLGFQGPLGDLQGLIELFLFFLGGARHRLNECISSLPIRFRTDTLLSLKVDPIFSFLEATGTQAGPGGPRGKPRGPQGALGTPFPGFPLGPPGSPWVPLASKKEKMESTFNERRVVNGASRSGWVQKEP